VGPARAVEICTTGRRYKAEAAHRMGLVAHLSGEENFQETVDGIVGEIKACSPLIIRLNKRAVNAHLGLDFKQALSGVSDLFLTTLMKTEDTLEGIRASRKSAGRCGKTGRCLQVQRSGSSAFRQR
jgi:enoyl-CoA hydratase/carnithine racemase